MPDLRWLQSYERSRLRGDVLAGAIVAALLVPQSLGYARIAGVPVEVGLYAVPLALLAYAVLGSSPQLIVGPASTVAIVSGSLVADIARDNPEDAVAITSALAIGAGLVLIATGLLRIAWIAEFLSKPIVTGFVFGLTLTIVIGELPTLLGLPKPAGDLIGVLIRTLRELGDVHAPTAIVGVGALALLFGGRRIAPRLPWGLVVLIVAVAAVRLLDLKGEGVVTIGEVPAGLPPFGLPLVPREDLAAVVVGGASLALVALAEGLAATRLFATRGGYRVETERELLGMGAANLGAGLTGGLGVAGSLSKTAAAEHAGSTSQVSGLTAAGLVLVVLLAFTWIFEDLPQAVLSAIVVAAVWGLMDVAAMRRYRHIRRADFVAGVVAAGGVVLFGPLPGLGIAIATSLLAIIYRSSAPRMEVLGRIGGEKAAWGRLRGHTSRREVPGIVVIRLDAPLFWANASAIADRLLGEMEQRPEARVLVLDLEATSQLDTTSADVLGYLHDELEKRDVQLYLARVIHPVSSLLRRSGFLDILGEDHMWHSISQCVRAARRATGLKMKKPQADAADAHSPPELEHHHRPAPDSAEIDIDLNGGQTSEVEIEILDDPSEPDDSESRFAGGDLVGPRDHVVAFYLMAFREGKATEACAAHVGSDLAVHGRGLGEGREGLVRFCDALSADPADRRVEIVRAFEDGPLVFLHVLSRFKGGPQLVTAEFFATDEEDRIVEHWRAEEPHQAWSWSGRTSIDGPTDTSELEWTDENKVLVRALVEEVLVAGDRSRRDEFFTDDYTEHGEALAGGDDEPIARHELVLLVGEGDFVATLCRASRDGVAGLYVDVFRVAFGAVVEHWGVGELGMPGT